MDELEALAAQLRTLREALRTRMNTTTVATESDRLYLQMLEVNHRIQMLNSVIFATNTAQVTQHLNAITDATRTVGEAIAAIDRLADVIGAVKNILGIVDGVIDLLS